MSCLVMHLLANIYYLFPLFSLVDPETDGAPVTDYVSDDPSSSTAELPGKQTPIDHSDIAHSLLSYACIRTAISSYDPIMMHSLFLLPAFMPYLFILNFLVYVG